jgi:SAM-dependent methyltransferase
LEQHRLGATDKVFAGSIPQIYDGFLVPLIFESYALDLAGRLAETEPQDVLETAAGTGVLTRAIASRIAVRARIVATDLNQPMLDHAKARMSRDEGIEWRQADAADLPFADQGFDAVACQFVSCSFLTSFRLTGRRAEFSSRAATSFSTSGTKFQKMSLPMS